MKFTFVGYAVGRYFLTTSPTLTFLNYILLPLVNPKVKEARKKMQETTENHVSLWCVSLSGSSNQSWQNSTKPKTNIFTLDQSWRGSLVVPSIFCLSDNSIFSTASFSLSSNNALHKNQLPQKPPFGIIKICIYFPAGKWRHFPPPCRQLTCPRKPQWSELGAV